jgi:diguanylate cyclase (GGDEF)-like protein
MKRPVPVPMSTPPSRPARRDPTPTARRISRGTPSSPGTEISLGSRVAGRVGVASLLWGLFAGTAVALALFAGGVTDPRALVGVLAAALASGIAAFVVVRRVFARRLSRVAELIEQRAATRSSAAIPIEDEELDQVTLAINRLLRTVSLDRGQSGADHSQREIALTLDLTRVTSELEQRLRERAMLFDVLRESTKTHDLDGVLHLLASRLGAVMRFREVAILLENEKGRFTIRAAWGFESPEKVLGREVEPGEGATGEALQTGKSVLISDVGDAPGYLAFWGEVQRTGSFMSVPIRTGGKMIGVLALTRGPSERLSEPEQRLVSALADQAALAIENARLFAKLEELSTHDELTGLPNRRSFKERLAREMADAKRYGHPLSVMVIDVDHFKKLNDREGHQAGDDALVEVSRVLQKSLREVDMVARYGGEEFVVILSRTAEADATKVGEKLRESVAAIDLASAAGQPLGHLSVSIGVAQLDDGEDGTSVVQRADRAVYVAKKEGRNRVSLPPPAPSNPPAAE